MIESTWQKVPTMARGDEKLTLTFKLDPAMATFIEAFRIELQSLHQMSDEEARGRLIKIIMQAFLQL